MLSITETLTESSALDVLADDGLVAFPTETVWGLAARAVSEKAVAALRDFKGRNHDKPFSILLDGPDRAAEVAAEWCDPARKLADAFWPGPLTLVVLCGQALAPGVAAADGSIGLRCSPHPVAAALAGGAFDRGLGPVTATSLNRRGEPPARDRREARRICGDVIAMLEGEAGGELASTVVDATTAPPRMLREGAIPADLLEVR